MALTHPGIPGRGRSGLTLLLAAAALSVSPALAWHEPGREVTEYSSATLESGEWRIYGTSLVEVGLTDEIQLGTVVLADVARVPNIFGKFQLPASDRLSFAFAAGVLGTNPKFFNDALPDVPIYLIPAGVYGSYRSDSSLALHASLQYVHLASGGGTTVADAFDVEASLSGSTLRLQPVLEWRRSRSFAWVVEGALSINQSGQATGGATFTSDDGRTQVEVFGQAGVEDAGRWLSNVTVSAYWSWETFNFRLGGGYGNWDMPLVGVFIGVPTPIVEFNMYWRF